MKMKLTKIRKCKLKEIVMRIKLKKIRMNKHNNVGSTGCMDPVIYVFSIPVVRISPRDQVRSNLLPKVKRG